VTGAPAGQPWDAPPARTGWPRARKIARWLAVAFTVALLGAGMAGGWALYGVQQYAEAHDGRILPGATINGIDVGGMDRDEAIAVVAATIDPILDREIVLRWGEETWQTSPRELGSTADVEEVVDAILGASGRVEWVDLARMRWRDVRFASSREVTVTHDPEAALALAGSIAASINRPARDAEVDLEGPDGWVEFTAERVGYHTDIAATAKRLVAAVEGEADEVTIEVADVQPAVTSDEFGQIILVRQHEHRVYLYEGGELVGDWQVAVGAPGYRTPTGVYEVTLKRSMPTWGNPAPDGWGRDMPRWIGPGRYNPLGLRALNWSVGAIRFHGTEEHWSLGRDVSKGCVRFSNDDVVEFFDLVDEGATIVSVRL
jgi:hypothetical protein